MLTYSSRVLFRTQSRLVQLRWGCRNLGQPPTMSPPSCPQQFIEHVVLFKLKDDADPSKVKAWLGGLNALVSLDQVLHLTAGPVVRCHSSGFFSFTHILHSRYSSKDDLAAYSSHPENLRVVRELGLPICEDIMAVDWVAQGFPGSLAIPPGSALRISLLKLKDAVGGSARDEVLAVTGKVIEGAGSGPAVQFTFGENFSPPRAKGFSIASLAVFEEPTEVEDAAESENSRRRIVGDHLDEVIVVDYAVPY